jgi:hypothetical protein
MQQDYPAFFFKFICVDEIELMILASVADLDPVGSGRLEPDPD